MKESEFDPDFIKNLLHTVSLDGLRVAASNLGLDVSSIPTEITPELREDETFLKAMHGLLMDVHVMEGRPSRLMTESGLKMLGMFTLRLWLIVRVHPQAP